MPFRRPYDVYDDTGYNRSNRDTTRRPQHSNARGHGAPPDVQERDGFSPYQVRDANPYANSYVDPYTDPYADRHRNSNGHNANPPANYGADMPAMMDPFRMFESMMGMTPQAGNGSSMTPQAENDGFMMPSLFGPMRGMMSAFDNLLDQAGPASMTQEQSSFYDFSHSGGQTYHQVSKSRTVGPDGRVREEVVRTTPGADGVPQTNRSVREAESLDQLPQAHFHDEMIEGGSRERSSDVIVEELDEDGNVISSTDTRRSIRAPEEQGEGDEVTTPVMNGPDCAAPRDDRSSWLHERYRHWFGNHP